MTNYEIIGCCVFVLLLLQSRKAFMGSVYLAVVWPIGITVLTYFAIKRYGFKRGPSEKYGELEVCGAALVGCAAFVGYLMVTKQFPGYGLEIHR